MPSRIPETLTMGLAVVVGRHTGADRAQRGVPLGPIQPLVMPFRVVGRYLEGMMRGQPGADAADGGMAMDKRVMLREGSRSQTENGR